eukprot:scaffold9492_cov108-Isochrysis_galbana.AAC.6
MPLASCRSPPAPPARSGNPRPSPPPPLPSPPHPPLKFFFFRRRKKPTADCLLPTGTAQRRASQYPKLKLQSPWGHSGSPTRGRQEIGGGTLAHRLTMLPCADSRGRFGDAWMSMTVSFGSEAEGAARASAGNCSMLTQK